jgi:hypothetical protein
MVLAGGRDHHFLELLVVAECPVLAHSGLFEQAGRTSAIGGKADIPRIPPMHHRAIVQLPALPKL